MAMKRAGYDIRLAEGDFHCGGCGGEICRGEEYGSSGMMICEGCIEVIEEDEMSFEDGIEAWLNDPEGGKD